jgi:hypothetical protein
MLEKCVSISNRKVLDQCKMKNAGNEKELTLRTMIVAVGL